MAKTIEQKVKCVTKMTREKHSFEGYSVRTQKHGYHCAKYVSASLKNFPIGTTQEQAWAVAHIDATADRETLYAILNTKKSWEGRKLTSAALKRVQRHGFRVTATVAY